MCVVEICRPRLPARLCVVYGPRRARPFTALGHDDHVGRMPWRTYLYPGIRLSGDRLLITRTGLFAFPLPFQVNFPFLRGDTALQIALFDYDRPCPSLNFLAAPFATVGLALEGFFVVRSIRG